jgi:hypothetical protein
LPCTVNYHTDGGEFHFEHPGNGLLPPALAPTLKYFFVSFGLLSVCHTSIIPLYPTKSMGLQVFILASIPRFTRLRVGFLDNKKRTPAVTPGDNRLGKV